MRAALCRCPACGRGKLFSRYLKQVETCTECGEPLGHIRADDGPAWLTIMVVGHLLAPFLLVFYSVAAIPDWALMLAWTVLALLLTLLVLPRAKALFIGVMWRSGGAG